MDDSEKLARQYLLSLGLGDVRYEPEGFKVPPDFLVDERIAVEVRRLNRNEVSESGAHGLEETQIPLILNMRKLLASFGPPTTGQSWFVSFEFSRPVLPKVRLERIIRKRLKAVRDGEVECQEIEITDSFRLTLRPASELHSDCFVLWSSTDFDSWDGRSLSYEKNIQICVQEKSRKIAGVRARYSEWWLVLLDFINFGERASVNMKHDWDKVILVNPLDPRTAYEV